MCICEITGAIFGIICILVGQYSVSRILSTILDSFGYILFIINYHFIMRLLTIDRFLAFYLNITYRVSLPPAKVLKLIKIVVSVSVIPTITFAVLIYLGEVILERLGSISFVSYLTFDAIYILTAIATYTYMLKVYKRQLKMRRNSQCTVYKENFNHLIRSLLIITFIIFAIIPDFYNMTRIYKIIDSHDTIADVASIFYRVRRMIDPLIYIFFSDCQNISQNYQTKRYSTSTIRSTSSSSNAC